MNSPETAVRSAPPPQEMRDRFPARAFAAPQPAALLAVEDMHACYDEHAVLHEVHCAFPERQVTAIMGPSGCGKSTLIKTLNRSLELMPRARVTRGRVLFRGQDIYAPGADPVAIRKHIGIIHQRPIPFPMSVLDNVLFGVRFHRRMAARAQRDLAQQLLERVGLWNEVSARLDAPASALSGGQQQRLCLARTLANAPDVILMDEPCSALDPAATRHIEALIAELKRDYTIVIVTHNMSQARRVSDQALFFYQGRLIEAGPTVELFERPREAMTREFVTGQIG
jgi:phosphate transport system ATP-binding protein